MASDPLDPVYDAAGKEWNVDPNLLRAVAGQESGGAANPDQAVSPKGALGRMQLMPATAQGLGVTDPNDPVQSIYGGAKYLSQQLDKYGSPELALAAYNAGPDRVDAYQAGKGMLPVETVAYVPSVAQRYQALSKPASAPAVSNRAAVAPPVATPASPVAQPVASAPDAYQLALQAAQTAQSPAQTVAAPVNDPYSQALQAAQSAQPVPDALATPPTVTEPVAQTGPLGNVVNFAEGAGHAALGASRALYGGINYLNNLYPVGSNTAGGLINAPAAISNLDAENAAYKASGTPDTLGGAVGNLVGQAATFAPAGGAIGAGARALGAGVDAVAPALAQNGLARLAGYGATGAVEGGGFGAVNSDGQPVGASAAQGALGGAAVGAGLPMLGGMLRGAGGMVANALSDVSPDTAALAQRARQAYGIDVTAPQMMPDGFIKTADNQLARIPGSGGASATASQQQQFTSAVARTIDPTTPTQNITRDFMQQQRSKIGGVLNSIETNHSVNLNDPQFIQDISQIQGLAGTTLNEQEQGQVSRLLDNTLTNLQPNGTIDGTTFGNLIHKGSALDKAADNSNSNIANAAQDIQDALRGAMQRSLPPDEAAAYQDARFRYKNLMTVAPLVDKTQPGIISPAALQQRVQQNFGADRIFSPATPLDELAQIGQRFLKDPANSGTADRTTINRVVLNPLGALSGAGALGLQAVQSPVSAALSAGGIALGAGAGVMATRGAGAALRSGYLANRLTNSALGQAAPTALPGMLKNSPAYGALVNRLAFGAPQPAGAQ